MIGKEEIDAKRQELDAIQERIRNLVLRMDRNRDEATIIRRLLDLEELNLDEIKKYLESAVSEIKSKIEETTGKL